MQNNKCTLIVGGLGYIGLSYFGNFSPSRLSQVILLDNKHNPPGLLRSNNNLVRCDIRNRHELFSIFKKYRPDTVILLAAKKKVTGFGKSRDMFTINVQGNINVVDAACACGVGLLLFSSSAAVYASKNSPVSENDPLQPLNEYGRGKLELERYIINKSQNSGMLYLIFRIFNVGGATTNQVVGEGKNSSHKLFQTLFRCYLGKQKNIYVYGSRYPTPDGTAIRDYVHINDVVRAMLSATDTIIKDRRSRVYNVGSGQGHSNLDVIKEFQKYFHTQLAIIYKHNRNENYFSVANINYIKKVTGWAPDDSRLTKMFDSGLMWYKQNPDLL